MKIVTLNLDGNLVAKLDGKLDERCGADLASYPARWKGRHVVLSLEGVGEVNSIGFRQWTDFLRALDAGSTFELAACGPEVVTYCGLLPGISFAARVSSIRVPYRCGHCRHERQEVMDVRGLDPQKAFPPGVCARCSGALTATVPASEYLEFLRKD